MRIVLVAVGTRGDVQPHLALSARLRARGHDARIAAPLDFEMEADRLGVPYLPVRVRLRDVLASPDGAALLASDRRPLRFFSILRRLAFPIVRQVIADIDSACEQADAVAYSPLALPAHYAARARGVPTVTTSLQPFGRTAEFASPIIPLNGRSPGFLNRATYTLTEQVFWQCFRPFIRRGLGHRLPAWRHFDDLYRSEQPVLFGFSSLVVPRPADWTPAMHATGYWTLPEDSGWTAPAALEEFLAAGDAPICVGFGSMHTPRVARLVDLSLAAIAGVGRRAILLTGWSGLPSDRAARGARVFVTDAVPHAWLFPRVAAVIHHGGAGTTAAACRAAVPSIILPFFFDQAFWGDRLHRLRIAAPPLSHRAASVEAIRSRLAAALDMADKESALRALADGLGREDGLGEAAAVIEARLTRPGA